MKIALTADIHISGKHLNRIITALSKAGLIADYKCEKFIIAGDVFDRYNIADRYASLGTIFNDVIYTMLGPECTAIPGNHDMAGADQKDALELLNNNWNIFRKETIVLYGNVLAAMYLPWGCNPDNIFNDPKDEEGWHSAMRRLIVGHADIAGSTTNTGEVMKGEGFTLDRDWIKSLDADVVALGHIHKKQDLGLGKVFGGYVGSLVQVRPEEGASYEPGKERDHQEQGLYIWDLKDNTIEFHEIEAPRYWLIPTERYTELQSLFDPQYDYVKVIGDVKPTELPEGVEYVKRIKVEEKKVRVAEATTDKTPAELLDIWLDEQGVETDQKAVHEGLKTLEGDVMMTVSAIGSLERINTIELENIATHRDVKIDLSGLSGLIAVAGVNGGGKSYLMESLYAALYGEYPSRPGTLSDQFTRGITGEGRIQVKFLSGGKQCEAERLIKKTARTGTVAARLSIEGKQVAGPKVADVNNACTRLVGDPQLLLASIYSVQEQSGNLIDALPAQRKELMAKLLGTDRYMIIGDAAKKRGKEDQDEVDYLAREIESLSLQIGSQTELEERIAEKESELEAVQEIAQLAEDGLSRINKEIAILDKLASDRERYKAELNREQDNAVSIEAKAFKTKEQIQGYKDRLKKRHDLELIASERNDYESQIKADRLKSDEYQIDKTELESQISKLNAEEKEIRYAYEALISQAKATLEKLVIETKARYERLETAHSTMEQNLQEKLWTLEDKARLLEMGDFSADICKTCVFTKDAFSAVEEHKQLLNEQNQLKPSEEMLTAKENYDQALREYETYKPIPIDQYNTRYREIGSERIVIEARLSELKEPDGTRIELNEAYIRNNIVPAELELARLKELDQLIEQKESEYNDLIKQLRETESRIDDAMIRYEKAENPEDRIRDYNRQKTDTEAKLKEIRSDISQIQIDIGKITEQISERNRTQAKITAKTEKMNMLKSKCERWTVLSRAFSRDGIPQLIVDSAIPRLQEIVNDLLGEFDHRWGIRMDTQYQTKSGSIQERFDIKVIDGTGEADISVFSGGEKHLLKTIIRVGIANLQAERSGKALKVFIFDEAFDKLRSDMGSKLLAVFKRLEENFNQIFIISHSDDLLSEISNRIQLEKKMDTTSVSVIKGM